MKTGTGIFLLCAIGATCLHAASSSPIAVDFSANGGRIIANPSAIGYGPDWAVATNAAGVTVTLDFMPTPHILRHTYITRLILGGMDLKRVQYLAGHADPKVTLQIYTDLMGHAPEDLIGDVTAVFAPPATPK